jgi:hypothetical protein
MILGWRTPSASSGCSGAVARVCVCAAQEGTLVGRPPLIYIVFPALTTAPPLVFERVEVGLAVTCLSVVLWVLKMFVEVSVPASEQGRGVTAEGAVRAAAGSIRVAMCV